MLPLNFCRNWVCAIVVGCVRSTSELHNIMEVHRRNDEASAMQDSLMACRAKVKSGQITQEEFEQIASVHSKFNESKGAK